MCGLLGGGSTSNTTTTQASNATTTDVTSNVSVATTTNIDLTPIQKLVDTLSGVNSASIDSLNSVVSAFGKAEAASAAAATQQAGATADLAKSIASGQSIEIWGALIGLIAAMVAAGLIGKKKGWL